MLARGARFGTYEVLEPIGAGGMGELFRARDTRLGRNVALKVLSDRFKLDSARRALLVHEARVLASLNHPNIATLHGIEETQDAQALVLELVDGITLDERIADGPMPVDEVLAIADQIAAALEAAHEHGVVHRDLKPQNVKLRSDGHLKLLDFGIAKVFAPVQGVGSSSSTVISPAGDAIVGTPAYMSPEQRRGAAVDKRTDIWAFGCVLFEMLTGRKAFSDEACSSTGATVVRHDVDFSALPRNAPTVLQRLIRRCLVEDVRRRLRDIGDARLDLMECLSQTPAEGAAMREHEGRRTLLVGALCVAVTALVVTGAWMRFGPDVSDGILREPMTRFVLSAQAPHRTFYGQSVAVGADGSRFAYITAEGLFVRARNQLTDTLVARTTDPGSGAPFIAPDGRWVVFSDGRTLKKVPVSGGVPTTLADSGPAAFPFWVGDEIIFASLQGLFRVPADGGAAVPLPLTLGVGEQVMYPQLLPDGRTVIVTISPSRSTTPAGLGNAPGAYVVALDAETGARRTLIRGGGHGWYVPTGHLLYAAGDVLYAVAFDLEGLEIRGEPVPLVRQLALADFAVSNEGTLIYVSGPASPLSLPVWVDRNGNEVAVDGAPPRNYVYPRLSPDGTRIAFDLADPEDRDIWIWNLGRETLERFTLDPAGNPLVAWSPDGNRLVFGSDRFGVTNLFAQASDGSDEAVRLHESDLIEQPMSFAPDGRLIFSAEVPGQARDVLALAMDGTGRIDPIVAGPANELWAEVSPDGRWIAFDSDESGQLEVYVRPYPDALTGGRWQISAGGGRQPLWSRDGGELYYRDVGGAVLAASVRLAPTFSAGPPRPLFNNASYRGAGAQGGGRTYDLSLDGSRFLMLKEQRTDDAGETVVVVLNWFEELLRLVPTG